MSELRHFEQSAATSLLYIIAMRSEGKDIEWGSRHVSRKGYRYGGADSNRRRGPCHWPTNPALVLSDYVSPKPSSGTFRHTLWVVRQSDLQPGGFPWPCKLLL